MDKDGSKPKRSQPMDIYQTVPAVKRQLSIGEMISIARAERAKHVAQEGRPQEPGVGPRND